MSGSLVRCLVAAVVVVSASSAVQAAPEAPGPVIEREKPATTAQAPSAEAAPAIATQAVKPAPPAPAPVMAERPTLPASEARPFTPAAVETPVGPVTPVEPASPAAPKPLTVQAPAVAPAPVQVMVPNNGGISDEERAKQILANEQRGSKPKLHALQTESPDYNIVVCEAGCGDSRAHIIYKQPVASLRSVLPDPAHAAAPLTKKAECRGGCDGNYRQKQASLSAPAPALLDDTAGSWMTTVEPSKSKAPASAAAKPQASKSLKEDWMARINRERAAASEQPQTEHPSQVEEKEPLIKDPANVREQNVREQ